MTLSRLAFAFVFAALADYLIKKYWGNKGTRIVWLIMAGGSLFVGVRDLNPLDMGFGILALWLAKPQRGFSPSNNNPDKTAQPEKDTSETATHT